MASYSADIPDAISHDLYWSPDYIQPIVQHIVLVDLMINFAAVADWNHLSMYLLNTAPVLVL